MKAEVGDWLVMKGFSVDQQEQRGLITEVHSDDGSPPYVVHWLDSGHVATVFPGPDAIVVTAAEPETGAAGQGRTGPLAFGWQPLDTGVCAKSALSVVGLATIPFGSCSLSG